MTDYTAKNRRAVAETIFPSNSALSKSLAENYRKQDEQLLVDEANNLVETRVQPTLPPEIEQVVNPSRAFSNSFPNGNGFQNSPQAFVNPGTQSQQQNIPQRQPTSFEGYNPLNTYTQGANTEANAYAKMGEQEVDAYKNVQGQLNGINQDIQSVQAKEEQAFNEFQKEDDDVKLKIKNFELQPKNFFAGKNTWQKILGGVGMFLGSITPEGAKNVANIIDKEIERDLDVQRNQLALLKDTRSEAANRYKMKLDRFGSDKLAKMSMKKDALEMVKLQLDQIASSAKGQLARGAALKGKAAIEQAQAQLQASIIQEHMKNNRSTDKGILPGYEGANQNPTVVKDLTDRLTAQRSANSSIDQLESLMNAGAFTGKNRQIAKQTREKLAADLAKAMFGRSSDSELEVARELIPDVTSLTQRKSVDRALLKNLKTKLAQDMDAAATAAGYRRSVPAGARKIN